MQKFNSDYASSAGIRAVVFDFGGVLFDWNPLHLYQQLIPDAAEREHFLTHICSPDWNISQVGGHGFPTFVLEQDGRFEVLDAGRWLGEPGAWREHLAAYTRR